MICINLQLRILVAYEEYLGMLKDDDEAMTEDEFTTKYLDEYYDHLRED